MTCLRSFPVRVPVEDLAAHDQSSGGSAPPTGKRKFSSTTLKTRADDEISEPTFQLSQALFPHTPVHATGYNQSFFCEIVYWSFGVLSLGVSFLLASWFYIAKLKFRNQKCPIDAATVVVVKTLSGKEFGIPLVARRVKTEDLRLSLGNAADIDDTTPMTSAGGSSQDEYAVALTFEFLCQQYVFDPWTVRFASIQFPIEGSSLSRVWEFHSQGLQCPATVASRRELFGKCIVDVPLKSSIELILSECFHPFYVFQICSLILWFSDNYYYYASAVLLLSCISLFASIRETLKNNRNLHEMAKFSCPVRVLRNPPPRPIIQLSPNQLTACLVEFDSPELVPGDIFAIERGMKLPCDGVLLTGSALVDESMMSGEAKPVHKTAIPTASDSHLEEYYRLSFAKHCRHILYGGSEVRDANNLGAPALCLVAKTGFSTQQGRMMRSLVHPVESSRINFEKETWKFVALLGLMSGFTFFLTLYQGIINELRPFTIFKRSVDTVTVAVPPALPIIISVGIICAQHALKKENGTHCLAPSVINVAGRANVIVFDKTGTLTEDDEDLLAIVPTVFIESSRSSMDSVGSTLRSRFPKGIPLSMSMSSISDENVARPRLGVPATSMKRLPSDLALGLATCHSLGFVDNELIGDPLEFQMFSFTGWRLFPPKFSKPSVAKQESSNGELIVETGIDQDADFYASVSPDTNDGEWEADASDIEMGTPQRLIDVKEDGDSLDIKEDGGDEATPEGATPSYAIVRVFAFDAFLQRMSVIIRSKETNELKLYSKGSPERIMALCCAESIPSGWDRTLSQLGERGLRVLAIAQKCLSVDPENSSLLTSGKIERASVETNLTFLGFLLFTNMLRPDSAACISALQCSGCCVYMATGDGLVTSAAIGYQAGILPSNIQVLISGVLVNNELKWMVKPFGASSLSPGLEAEGSVTGETSTVSEEDRKDEEFDSLQKLLEGRCLSKVGLCITGEAFRYVAASGSNCDLSPLSLDRLEVAAFCAEEKKLSGSCLACRRAFRSINAVRCDKTNRSMNTLEFVLRYFQIFSRMSPDDKALLIQKLQGLSNFPVVGMCGDGANDCAALKASDVGISLSAREASVAAPFNCAQQKTISVVVSVFREGRGALANSIQNFQFVALYALIQLCAVTLLSHFGASLTDAQFLFLDLGLVLPLSYCMSWSKSSSTITRVLPPQSLLAWSIVVSLFGQVLTQVLFQVFTLFVVLPKAGKSFYVRFQVDPENETNFIGYENTVIFMIANVQTVMTALVLAFGTRPWKYVTRNGWFLFVSLLLGIIGFALVLNEAPYIMWLRRILCVTSLPLSFRTILLLIISINILISVIVEEAIVRRILRRMEIRQDDKNLNRESLRGPAIDEQVVKPAPPSNDLHLAIDD